jgi:hypothetical protein
MSNICFDDLPVGSVTATVETGVNTGPVTPAGGGSALRDAL